MESNLVVKYYIWQTGTQMSILFFFNFLSIDGNVHCLYIYKIINILISFVFFIYMWNLIIYMNCNNHKATDVGKKKNCWIGTLCIHERKIAQVYSATTIDLFYEMALILIVLFKHFTISKIIYLQNTVLTFLKMYMLNLFFSLTTIYSILSKNSFQLLFFFPSKF